MKKCKRNRQTESFNVSLLSVASYNGKLLCENYQHIKNMSRAACPSQWLPFFLILSLFSHVSLSPALPLSIIPYLSTTLPSVFSPFIHSPELPRPAPHLHLIPSSATHMSPDLLFLCQFVKVAMCFVPLSSSQLYLYLSFFPCSLFWIRPASCLSHACPPCPSGFLCMFELPYSAVYLHGSVSLWTSFL